MPFNGEMEESEGEDVIFFEAGYAKVGMGEAFLTFLPAVERLERLKGKLEEEQGSAATPIPNLAGSQENGTVKVIETAALEEG
jgi:hypothetical protein